MKRYYMIALAAIVLLAVLPLVPLMLGSTCVSNGQEIGQAFSSVVISAWISAFAWPLATLALVVWIIALLAHLVIGRSRRRRAERVV